MHLIVKNSKFRQFIFAIQKFIQGSLKTQLVYNMKIYIFEIYLVDTWDLSFFSVTFSLHPCFTWFCSWSSVLEPREEGGGRGCVLLWPSGCA